MLFLCNNGELFSLLCVPPTEKIGLISPFVVAPAAHFHHPHNTFSQATMFLQSLHTVNNDMPKAVSSGPARRFLAGLEMKW